MDGGRILEQELARAGILADAGDIPGAEHVYRGALAVDPDCAEARAGLGAVLLASARATDAEPEFRRALTAGAVGARTGLALCLRARGAVLEARTLLEEAIASGGDDPLWHDLLAELPVPTDGLEPDLEATGLRFTYGEEFLGLSCRRCGRSWEQALPSAMCELPVVCPGCAAHGHLDPESAVALIARLEPGLAPAAADALDQTLAAMVGSWHADAALQRLLAIGDVNLGECAEHEVMAIVLDAALAALPRESA